MEVFFNHQKLQWQNIISYFYIYFSQPIIVKKKKKNLLLQVNMLYVGFKSFQSYLLGNAVTKHIANQSISDAPSYSLLKWNINTIQSKIALLVENVLAQRVMYFKAKNIYFYKV